MGTKSILDILTFVFIPTILFVHSSLSEHPQHDDDESSQSVKSRSKESTAWNGIDTITIPWPRQLALFFAETKFEDLVS